jgi:CPA2 family monovalent cation:H+ antiporter-2
MVQTIQDLTILLLVSLPINILFHKIKLPSVMGFLIAGILIGPHGLQLIGDLESVNHLAEIGVILLLFIIGLEFSLGHLVKNLSRILRAGGLQLGLTTLLVYLVLASQGFSGNQSLVLGLLVALSSTAIVLKMITDRAEIDTIHGRLCIGVLLFQDVCVVPLMLIVPLLAQSGPTGSVDLLLAMLKSLAAVGGIFFLSRLMVPRALEAIARLGSKEHLTLFVILIIMGTGWVSEKMGLSLAMGAFIAGVILSESEYNHQIILDILPLKDYFASIFFISVGMLLQTDIFFNSPLTLLGLTLGVILLKAGVASIAALLVKTNIRISFIVGLRLAQIGEFSLILASLALDHQLLDNTLYQSFLIISILSMLIAPLLIQGSSRISIALFSRFGTVTREEGEGDAIQSLTDHVVIAGYGLVGRNLAKVLREINIPYMVIELDGELIKQALTEKAMVLYGDPTHRDTLNRARISDARVIVVSIPDAQATEQTVRLSRKLNSNLYIMVRTRFASQVEGLTHAGANQVIPEEFETSIEIFSRVLQEFRIPNNIIEQQVELVRLEGYSMFRGLSLNVESLKKFSTYLAASLSKSFQVMDSSWARNRRLQDIQLKENTGATLIAVVRNNQAQPHPEEAFEVEPGDTLILFGRHLQVDRALKYLEEGPKPKEESSR